MSKTDLRKVFSPGDKVVNAFTYDAYLVLDVNAKSLFLQSIDTGQQGWSADQAEYIPLLPPLLTYLKSRIKYLERMLDYQGQIREYHENSINLLRAMIEHHERILNGID